MIVNDTLYNIVLEMDLTIGTLSVQNGFQYTFNTRLGNQSIYW